MRVHIVHHTSQSFQDCDEFLPFSVYTTMLQGDSDDDIHLKQYLYHSEAERDEYDDQSTNVQAALAASLQKQE